MFYFPTKRSNHFKCIVDTRLFITVFCEVKKWMKHDKKNLVWIGIVLQVNIVKVTSPLRLWSPLYLLTSRTDIFTHFPKHDRDQLTFCYQTKLGVPCCYAIVGSGNKLQNNDHWIQYSLKHQFLNLIIVKRENLLPNPYFY